MFTSGAPLRSATPIHQLHALYRRDEPAATLDRGPPGNALLKSLPAAVWQRWSHQLERVEMPLGQVLYEGGRSIVTVYFPTTSIVSLLHLSANDDCSEVASIGHDGLVGMPLLMGGVSTNGRAVVQSAGQGYRLKGQLLVDEFYRGGAVTQLLLNYNQALLTQVAQTAACNRFHAIDQQVCRLILLSLDRLHDNDLRTTHELLASRLGVRRESVTKVALDLQRAGLIRYSRGHVEVLDRAGLEARVCECYTVVKLECHRLLALARARPVDRWTNYQNRELGND